MPGNRNVGRRQATSAWRGWPGRWSAELAPRLAATLLFALAWRGHALGQDAGTAERIRQELDEILAQPDFRRLDLEPEFPEVPTDWLDRIAEWLRGQFNLPPASLGWMGDVVRGIAWFFIAAIGCLIIWLVVRAVNQYRALAAARLAKSLRPEEGEADLPPGDLPADEYLRRAQEYAGNGLFREAIVQLIKGAMSNTERAGLIRFRRGYTHRDYLRALRARPITFQSFRSMVAIYEPIGFGRRAATSEHFEASREAYAAGFAAPLQEVA